MTVQREPWSGSGDGAAPRAGRGGGGHRAWGIACVLVGTVLLAVAFAAFAGIPGQLRAEHAYLAAEPCTRPSGDGQQCLKMLPATVLGAEKHSSRSGVTYDVTTETPAGRSSTVTGLGAGPPAERLRPGDEVTLGIWRGEITALSRGGVTQQVPGGPDSGPQMYTVLAMESAVLAGWSLFAGLLAVRRAGHAAGQGMRPVVRTLLLPVAATVLLALLPALLTRNGQDAAPVIATLTAWAGLEALALWLLRGRLRALRA